MMDYTLYNGDCLDVLLTLADNSFDSIVTDPPYELGFMGKAWDGSGIAYNVDVWRECLRVLKPGGHLLAFGGSRTYHRLACAVEDAGFEIRDQIMWVYGCLSDDTEILTRNGWERFHIPTNDDIIIGKEILVYDIQNDVYKWEKPERWSYYSVEQDTAYRIQSDYTDQIVSRNHRCIVERGGELVFEAAEKLANLEYMPTLSDDFLGVSQGHEPVLQSGVQRVLPGQGLGEARKQGAGGMERRNEGCLSPVADGRKQPSLERRSNLLQTQGEVCEPINQVCEMPAGVSFDGPQGWVRDGASAYSGASNGAGVVTLGSGASHQPRRNGQQDRESDAFFVECRPQETRTRPSYRTALATVTPIEYTGTIFCPTVSTGAFVARRNGKIFITGNSGFPKSLSVSKAIDNAAGAEREVVGKKTGRAATPVSDMRGGRMHAGGAIAGAFDASSITAPATPEAQQWDGWGTALKPAHEPIVVARKPLAEKTIAANVLEWGTGAINVDGCRVGTEERIKITGVNNQRPEKGALKQGSYADGTTHQGRWPANLIHDGSDEVLGLFPQNVKGQVGMSKTQGGYRFIEGDTESVQKFAYGSSDSGSAARFFYCPKASKADKNDGCEGLEERYRLRDDLTPEQREFVIGELQRLGVA